MTLALLVDESADSHVLRRLPAAAGHRVVIAGDVELLGTRDEALFAYAQTHRLTHTEQRMTTCRKEQVVMYSHSLVDR